MPTEARREGQRDEAERERERERERVVCEREERVSDIAGPSTRGREAEQNPTMAPYIPQRHFKTRTVVGSLFVLMRSEMLALYCFSGIAGLGPAMPWLFAWRQRCKLLHHIN